MIKQSVKMLLAFLVLLAVPSWAQSYPATDSFSGSGALSASWTQAAPTGLSYPPVALVRSSGTVVPGTASPPTTYPWGLALYSGETFNSDQYAQAVFVTHSTAGGRTGPCVLMSSVGSGYCYSGDDGVVHGYSDTIYDTIPVTGCPIPASGDTIKLSTVGTTLTCTDVTTGVSASGPASAGYHTTGMPGVFVDQFYGSTVYALTSFQADCIPTCSLGTVATPTFSPVAGTYSSAQTVTISDSTSGATLHYTTDGTTPTATSATYSTPITVSVSETVKALGIKTGWTNSAVGSAAYVISSGYPATDSFSGSGALSSNWTQAAPTGLSYPPVALVRSSGTVVPGAASPPTTYPWGLALYSSETFTNDQYAQAVFVTHSTAGGRTGPCVLMSSVGSGYCYSGDDGVIHGYSDAIYDTIPVTGCPIPASGDVIKLSTVGTTLTCTDVTTGVSASGPASAGYHTSGMPGVFVDQMNSTVYALTSFQADCIPTCGTGGGTVATPTFSPVAGTYTSAQTVTISDSTSGATLHYTTNGTTPTASSTTYTAPISVSTTETVKALGVKSGWTNSAVGSAVYTLKVATPTFSPVAGTYGSAQSVAISTTTSGATLHYTTDGTTPTASSTTYTTPIAVSVSETVKAIGIETGYTNSAVGSAAYVISTTVATPTFSPVAGTYNAAQSVTISDATSGATIHYTTDGSTPTASSTTYSSPIAVSVSETVKAIGIKTGLTNSAVGSAAYTLTVATPTFSPGAGSYGSAQTVTISTTSAGATLHYTTDGSTPTGSSTTYSSPITVSVSETVQAIGIKTGWTTSAVGSAAYTISGGSGQTWYVRTDGGTRYSSNMPLGQCNGKYDVSYASTGGTGTNQNCAFNDFRYMWDDRSGLVGSGAWVIAGGDTVVIRGCTALSGQVNPANPACRIGWDGPTGAASDNWCYGVGSYTCYNPPIPAGTAAQHTRILGQCVLAGTCNTGNVTNRANLTQLFGGFSLTETFNLESTNYVDIEGFELTTHNGACSHHGAPQYPRGCSTNQPLDDYADIGILTNNATSHVTFQDFYVDGFESNGFFGPIGGPITMTRVNVSFNASAGWQFDDGSSTPDAAGSQIIANYVTMNGNGCKQQYPIVNTAWPALACWDDVSGGFGDAWSGQNTELDVFTCNHCVMEYNTKDAFIGPHTQVAALTVTDTYSIGNMGAQMKFGSTTNANVLFQNNLLVMNCFRQTAALPGAAQNFAQSSGLGGSYLTDYCRAGGDGMSFLTRAGSTNHFYGNSLIGANATMLDINCGYVDGGGVHEETNCTTAPLVWTDNLFMGYVDPDNGSQPGLWYFDPGAGGSLVLNASYDDEFGVRDGDTCGTNHILCSDPLLTSEPAEPWPGSEAALDNFNFTPTSGSPLVGAGIAVTGLTTDYNGTTRPNPPSMGGVE